MGMFDYVRCEVLLPDAFEGGCQTKDFDCEMCRIEIRADGSLWIERFDREVVPKAERPHPDAEGMLGLMGMLRRVNVRWELIDFHGVMNFYGDDKAGGWHEYNAKFTDGRLVSIEAALMTNGGFDCGAGGGKVL
jgi:hypothetical protein